MGDGLNACDAVRRPRTWSIVGATPFPDCPRAPATPYATDGCLLPAARETSNSDREDA